MFQLISDLINVCLLAVGGTALGVYKRQKRDEVKAAATLLKSQIDSVEKVVKDLKSIGQLSNQIIYQQPVILSRNYWEESKHLLIKKIGLDGVKLLEEFYGQAEQLEKTRGDICHELVTAWEHKDLIVQEKLYDYYNNDLDEVKKSQLKKNLSGFEENDKIFTPGLPVDIFIKNLEDFRLLSGTTVYQKLSEISYYKK